MNDYYLKSIEYSKISTQLKSFRSLVRLKEIKKTLQEQRYKRKRKIWFYIKYFVFKLFLFLFVLEFYFYKHKWKKLKKLRVN